MVPADDLVTSRYQHRILCTPIVLGQHSASHC